MQCKTPARVTRAGVDVWRTTFVPESPRRYLQGKMPAPPDREISDGPDMTAFPIQSIRRAGSAPRLLLSALLAGLLVWTLPAGPASAQSGVERLTNKVDRLQRELNDLQRQVYRGEGGSQAAPSDGGGQATGGSAGMTQAAATRLQQKLTQLERAVQDLTGRMERVQYELRQLTERMDKRAKDVDYRLGQLEQATGVSAADGGQQTGQSGNGQSGNGRVGNAQSGSARSENGQTGGQGQQTGTAQQAENLNQRQGTGGGQQAGQGANGQQSQQRQSTQDGQGQQGNTLGQVSQRAVDELRQGQGDQQSGAQQGQQAGADGEAGDGEPGQQTASVNVELPDGPPQDQYDYAFGLLRQADYAQAEQALSKFLDAHPEHELAGNAKYWLGETFYVRGNYERAAVTFAEGFQTYPESQKAPDNLLKLGMSLAQIDRTEDACGIFAELQSRYPDAKNNILQRAEREESRLNCGQG
jgi:tol-pal system protein YbgF